MSSRVEYSRYSGQSQHPRFSPLLLCSISGVVDQDVATPRLNLLFVSSCGRLPDPIQQMKENLQDGAVNNLLFYLCPANKIYRNKRQIRSVEKLLFSLPLTPGHFNDPPLDPITL